MDIQEFEGLLHHIITDDNSTEACRRTFEKNLAALEKKDAEYVDRTFIRQRKFFGDKLLGIAAQKETPETHAAKITLLQKSINRASKADAYSIIQKGRAALRLQIPEFKRHDEVEAVVSKEFTGMFSPDEQKNIVALVENNDVENLTMIGDRLTGQRYIQFFDILSDLMPEQEIFMQKFCFKVKCEGKKEQASHALNKKERRGIKNFEDALIFGFLARKSENKTAMEKALPLLENHLDKREGLIVYATIAKKLEYPKAIKLALEKLEDDRGDDTLLRIYGELARMMRDKWRMEIALVELEPKIEDRKNLVQYAALAKDLKDEEGMDKAMFHLVEKLDDPSCLTIYAVITRVVNDKEEMRRCLRLLEPQIDTDNWCLRTYATLARAVNDRTRRITALSKIKKILGLERERNHKLYMKVAEGA